MMTLQQLAKLEGGRNPTSSEAQQMAKHAYGEAPPQVGDFRLIKASPGIAFYEDNDGTVVMAIAGTRSLNEAVTEWWRIPTNQLVNGTRYKEAESALRAAKREFPDATGWFGVGHSLAGAIIDALIDRGLLDAGQSFNPAVEAKQLLKPSKNTRTFQEGDILATLGKPFLPGAQFRKRGMWATRIARAFKPWLIDAIQQHDIDNFAEPEPAGGIGAVGGDSGGIRPMICRVGSKARFAKLLDFIAPPHKVYVEPFAGSAAFFWHKEPVEREYLNDLDASVVHTLRLIKKAPTDMNKYPNLDTMNTYEGAKRFYQKKPTTVAQQLVWHLISFCGGWRGQVVNPETAHVKVENLGRSIGNKLKHIAEYKQRLKNTTITREDYAKVMRAHNNKDTFIFMDPPYEASHDFSYAEEEGFDYERFAAEVGKLRANWLITINDSPRIRKLFSKYHITPITIKGWMTAKKTIGSKDRKELLISNFALPSGWRKHAGARVTGGMGNWFARDAAVAPAPEADAPPPVDDEPDAPDAPDFAAAAAEGDDEPELPARRPRQGTPPDLYYEDDVVLPPEIAASMSELDYALFQRKLRDQHTVIDLVERYDYMVAEGIHGDAAALAALKNLEAREEEYYKHFEGHPMEGALDAILSENLARLQALREGFTAHLRA